MAALRVSTLKACTIFFLCWLMFPVLGFSQVKVPQLNAAVTDLTGTLSPSEIQALEARLTALQKRKGSQLVIVMLPSTQPQDIESFALAVFEKNKIGRAKSDDGVLLLVAKDDRKVRIEVGYGLEGAIPDAIASRIIHEYLGPKFRQNDYAGGLNEASAIIEKIIDGEPLPEPLTTGSGHQEQAAPSWIFALFIGLFVGIFTAGTRIRPVFIRRVLAAGAAGFLAWMLFSLGLGAILSAVIAFLISGSQSSGRYVTHGGGGFMGGGGWGDGGSSGGGGWSGGGGSSGGGGASGGW
jgi:uncharacterized protein